MLSDKSSDILVWGYVKNKICNVPLQQQTNIVQQIFMIIVNECRNMPAILIQLQNAFVSITCFRHSVNRCSTALRKFGKIDYSEIAKMGNFKCSTIIWCFWFSFQRFQQP